METALKQQIPRNRAPDPLPCHGKLTSIGRKETIARRKKATTANCFESKQPNTSMYIKCQRGGSEREEGHVRIATGNSQEVSIFLSFNVSQGRAPASHTLEPTTGGDQ